MAGLSQRFIFVSSLPKLCSRSSWTTSKKQAESSGKEEATVYESLYEMVVDTRLNPKEALYQAFSALLCSGPVFVPTQSYG